MITNKIKSIKEQVGKNQKVSGLSDALADPDFLIQCWVKIRSKPGGTTPSIDNETLDGIDMGWFKKTASEMRNGLFKFRPSRRIYIKKKSGGKRPLAIPSPRDKIVQEGIKELLELVYDGSFSESSHGFRASRGCHTALNDIRIHFGGVRWFIEGDIKRQFDLVNHSILMSLIKERIEDQAFIDLLYKYLRAGYCSNLHGVEYSLTGVPQGGVTSPILSNIYMDGLDKFMEETIIPKWTIGNKRKQHPMYTKMTRSGKAPTDPKIPRVIGNDPGFKRVRYVRYADDFLIGVIGSKKDCESIKAKIGNWLMEERALELNVEKTYVTHATESSASFLGHRIHLTEAKRKPRRKVIKGGTVRTVTTTPRPQMDAPIGDLVKGLEEKGYCRRGGKPTRSGKLIHLEVPDIITHYRQLENGLRSYYAMSSNFGHFSARIHYILKYSCALTICSKLRLRTLRKTFKRFGADLTQIKSNGEIGVSYPTPNGHYKKPKKGKGPAFVSSPEVLIDRFSKRINRGRGDLEAKCYLCHATDNIEIHHVRKLAKKK